MTDLATLGLAVDSSQVEKGVVSLDRLSAAAKKTEATVETAGKGLERAGQRMAGTSKAAERVAQEAAKVDRAMSGLSPAAQRAADAIEKVDAAADALTGSLGRARDANGRYAKSANDNAVATDRVAREMGKAQREATILGRANAAVARSYETLGLAASSARGMMIGLATGALGALGIGGGAALAGIVSTTAEFERLKGSLQTVTGSAQAADKAMAFVKDFAKTTPFDVQQVTEAFIRLKLLGLDPSAAALTSYGNTASAMGRPLMQFIEAIADATTGEFERLKEFGIKASVDGERVGFTFKGQSTIVKNAAADIEKYLRNIGDVNFAGGMDRQAASLGGALSNVQDSVANFQDAIGRGGLADALADAARETSSLLDANHGLAASFGGVLGDAIRDTGRLISEVSEAAGYMEGKFREAGSGILDVVAGISASGHAAMAGFLRAWDNFPEFLQAVGISAVNAFLSVIERALNDALGEINRMIGLVNSLGDIVGMKPIEIFAPVDLKGLKQEYTGAAVDIAAAVSEAYDQNKGRIRKALGDMLGGGEAVGQQLQLKYGIRETADAASTLGSSASAAGSAIDGGITKPSKEAAKALRDAEAAKKALLSEADAAVGEFFPMAKAAQEAARLTAIINDTSNGLSDLQRNALGLQIAKNFEDAQPKVERLRDAGTKAAEDIGQSFISNVGDVFADVFSQATRDGDDFFGSIIRGFAGLGSQLAAAGGKNLLGQLFGIKDPSASSAAGIGGLLTGAGSAASSFVPTASTRPSSAAMAMSSKLAEGVTQSVSSNLLSSILGAGKSSSHISGLNTNFANALTNMLEAAPEAVRSAVTINSGFRSVARQAELFDAALKKYGSVSAARKWVAPPGNSKHNVGMAADLGYAGADAKSWIHQNAGKFGLAFPLGNEDWHIELASARGGNTKAIEKGVSQGVQQGLRATANQTGGGDAWAGMRETSGGAQQMTGAQRGLGAIGAGLGIFGQGYESGSPLSGGVSGALGGYQAATALGFAGPIGAIAGAGLGILGGILGGRAKRKAAHEEAAKKWEEVRPQYEAFDRSLSGEGVGQLRAQNEELWGQLNSFMQVGGAAWKMGSGNSSAQFASTGTKMFQKIHDSMKEFREGFSYMLEDLMGGEGLEGAFAKGRANVKALGEQVKGFIDDVEIAWGSADNGLPTGAPGDAIDKEWKSARDAAVEKAKAAAGAYALTMLYTADTTSDVQKAIDSFRGTAAGLQPILEKLGWSADEAARAIDERLTQALTKMRGDFEEGIADEVNNLDGKGYLAEVREMIEAFEQTKKDAELLGADSSLLPKLFELQGQAIVDGAELTGDAFADLIKAFPALAGVVEEFNENAVKRTSSQLKSVIEGYDDRTFAATNNGTGLAGQLAIFDRAAQKEREAEVAAGGKAMAELERALAAERLKIVRESGQQLAMTAYEASKSQLQGLYENLSSFSDSLKDFLSNMLIGDSSTLSGQDQLAESRRIYEETLAKANAGDGSARDELLGVTQTYLDQAKSYYASSEDYAAIFDGVQASLKATDAKTTSQLDVMRSSARWLELISTNTLTVATALSDYLTAQKTLNTNRTWGAMADQNKAIVRDLSGVGIDYTGNFGGGQFLDWVAAQLPSQQAIINAIIQKNQPVAGSLPGVVGAYQSGGIVGNGIWNQDSVLARYAGGGHIGLAGGEFVVPAPMVTPQTKPMLEGLRQGRVPANDSSMVAELRALRDEVRSLKAVTAEGALAVKGSVDSGVSLQRQQVSEQKKMGAR